MNKRKLCKYDQFIQELALALYKDFGPLIDSQTIGQSIQEAAAKTGWLYSELTADINKEIDEIISTSVKP